MTGGGRRPWTFDAVLTTFIAIVLLHPGGLVGATTLPRLFGRRGRTSLGPDRVDGTRPA